jgi:hypothetical protein
VTKAKQIQGLHSESLRPAKSVQKKAKDGDNEDPTAFDDGFEAGAKA